MPFLRVYARFCTCVPVCHLYVCSFASSTLLRAGASHMSSGFGRVADADYAYCSEPSCGASFKKSGYYWSSNLRRHMKEAHPEIDNRTTTVPALDQEAIKWAIQNQSDFDDSSEEDEGVGNEQAAFIEDLEALEGAAALSGTDSDTDVADDADVCAEGSYLHSPDWHTQYPACCPTLPESTFPFASKASYRFHLWCCLRGFKIADGCLDVLLSIFEDELPGFAAFKQTMLCNCKTVKGFMAKMDKRMPRPQSTSVHVARSSTAYDVGNQVRRTTVAASVDVVSITSCLVFLFSTPDMRRHVVAGINDVGDEHVQEFNETPFVRNAFKYQKLLSFHTDAEEICVGDFITAKCVPDLHSCPPECLLRVESLFYARIQMTDEGCGGQAVEGTLLPKLHIRGRFADCISESSEGMAVRLRADKPLQDVPAEKVVRRIAFIDKAESYTRTRHGTDVAYEPLKVLWTPRAVTSGDPFIWLNFYIDKFESVGKNNRSTEAIYMEVANVDSRFSYGQEFVFTIALLPSGCSLADAWEPQRKELARMVKRGLVMYDVSVKANVKVGVGVAGLIGDHMQQVVNTRTYGPSGTLNSRACSWRKDECHKTSKDGHSSCQHFSLLRRHEQTEVAIDQIRESLQLRAAKKKSKQYTQTAVDAESRHYGLHPLDSMWRGCGVDPHRQAWWDAAHLLFLGIIKMALKAIVEGLSGAGQEIFQTRIRLFPWPKACSPPINVIKANFGTSVTIEGWRLMSLASMWALDGLALQGDLEWVIKMHYFATDVMGPLSAADVVRLQRVSRELVEEGGAVVGPNWTDKPNIHGLLELPWHTLSALRSGRFPDTRKFEARNKGSKGYANGMKSGRGGQGGEGNAMKYDRRLVSHRTLAGGIHWGPNGMYGLGPALVGWRDPRPHRGNQPHPEIRKLTRLARTTKQPDAMSLIKKAPGVHPSSPPPKPEDQAYWVVDSVGAAVDVREAASAPYLRFAVEAVGEYYDEINSENITAIHCIKRVRTNGTHRAELLSPGDHVACTWGMDGNRGRHYCRLARIVLVVAKGKSFLFFAPQWYLYPAAGLRKHTLRDTEVVRRGNWPADPDAMYQWVAFSSISYQVGVVHSCIRTTGTRSCETAQFCVLHNSKVTSLRPCETCGRQGKSVGNDVHCDANNVYEIIDRSKGFVATTELDYIY